MKILCIDDREQAFILKYYLNKLKKTRFHRISKDAVDSILSINKIMQSTNDIIIIPFSLHIKFLSQFLYLLHFENNARRLVLYSALSHPSKTIFQLFDGFIPKPCAPQIIEDVFYLETKIARINDQHTLNTILYSLYRETPLLWKAS